MSSENDFVKEIANKDEDWSQWYVDVIRKAELADYSPVRGCMVIRPYGFTIWEAMKEGLDRHQGNRTPKRLLPSVYTRGLLRKKQTMWKAAGVAWIARAATNPWQSPWQCAPLRKL